MYNFYIQMDMVIVVENSESNRQIMNNYLSCDDVVGFSIGELENGEFMSDGSVVFLDGQAIAMKKSINLLKQSIWRS